MASSSIVCSARFGPLLQMENVLSSGDISKTKSAQEVVLKLLETKTKIWGQQQCFWGGVCLTDPSKSAHGDVCVLAVQTAKLMENLFG